MSDKKVQEAAAGLSDLDLNVSDEEINRAKQIWHETDKNVDYLKVNTIIHPV